LATIIFSDDNEVKMVRGLCGDDAQSFIDVIDEVSLHTLSPPRNGSVDSHLNFLTLSVRYWIVSRNRSARGVCALYTGFVVVKP